MMYLILYVDRVNISTAAPLIKVDLALSNIQLGLAFSAFAYPYALFQLIGGYFGDKFDPRLTLCVCSLIVCVATTATGLVGGFASLFAARLALGVGEGATFPTRGVHHEFRECAGAGCGSAMMVRRRWDHGISITAGQFLRDSPAQTRTSVMAHVYFRDLPVYLSRLHQVVGRVCKTVDNGLTRRIAESGPSRAKKRLMQRNKFVCKRYGRTPVRLL